MALELRQQLKLAQQLVMTPQLQQAIKLLQLSRVELLETVQQEMLDNLAKLAKEMQRELPGAVAAVGFRKWLMIMPRNSAITDAPMKCSPAAFSSASSPLAVAASTSAIAIPGRYFTTFFMKRTPFSFCVFILSLHCDKIKS